MKECGGGFTLKRCQLDGHSELKPKCPLPRKCKMTKQQQMQQRKQPQRKEDLLIQV